MKTKPHLRSLWQARLAENTRTAAWGKVAQKLRGLKDYLDAATVFATPEPSLQQVRINCLVDGKNLVMPGPALQEGFYLLPSRSVSFRDIPAAITFRGLKKKGILLQHGDIEKLSLGLLLTGALAVDRQGGRIGEGKGFFDLSCALLQALGGLAPHWAAYALVGETCISAKPLPQDTWDIKLAGAITPAEILTFARTSQKPQIYWDTLPFDRIRSSNPLWKLYTTTAKT